MSTPPSPLPVPFFLSQDRSPSSPTVYVAYLSFFFRRSRFLLSSLRRASVSVHSSRIQNVHLVIAHRWARRKIGSSEKINRSITGQLYELTSRHRQSSSSSAPSAVPMHAAPKKCRRHNNNGNSNSNNINNSITSSSTNTSKNDRTHSRPPVAPAHGGGGGGGCVSSPRSEAPGKPGSTDNAIGLGGGSTGAVAVRRGANGERANVGVVGVQGGGTRRGRTDRVSKLSSALDGIETRAEAAGRRVGGRVAEKVRDCVLPK